jgi:[histone H3]-lysine36 N-dimethyltransferase SETMAR
VSKLGTWVPHELSVKNKADRLRIAAENLNLYGQALLPLDSILTGDEKWVLYVNVTRRREWVLKGQSAAPTPKAGLHPKKCLLSFFWDTEGIVSLLLFLIFIVLLGVVYWEIVPAGRTINAEYYCGQLDRLNEAMQENRPHRQGHNVSIFLKCFVALTFVFRLNFSTTTPLHIRRD